MPGNCKTALIIEDSVTQALSLRLLLENAGMRVVHTLNGSHGISLANQILPDVIVLDIEMPGMNGFEVSVRLSHDPRTERIPIILLTAHDTATDMLKGMKLGAIDFIPKDIFAEAVLLETLRQLHLLSEQDCRQEGQDELAAPAS